MRITPSFDETLNPASGDARGISRRELGFHIRRHARANLYDESKQSAAGVALYGLSDPRDFRDIRYIGQTRTPAKRFLQHMANAQLWLPDELPWWIKSPRLRPLYSWVRQLYSEEEQRLPVMLITTWVSSLKEARLAERARIMECLQAGRTLYNVETELLGRQLPLV